MIELHFAMKIKSKAQAVLLLMTLEQSGCKLDEVRLKTDRGEVSGTEALAAWRSRYLKDG